jgi:hypothetical protein
LVAAIHVNVSLGVFALTVDDILPVEGIALLKWLIGPKAVGGDSQRLLLAVSKQELNRRLRPIPVLKPILCADVILCVGHAGTDRSRADRLSTCEIRSAHLVRRCGQ